MATILIVEDRAIDRKLLTAVLRSGGHEVVAAADGGDALEYLSKHRADLIISDILMPSIDGYELVRRVRESSPQPDIPVIFYTATYHEREAHALAAQCGVRSILTKPSTPDAILAAVAGTLAPAGGAAPAPTDRAQFDRDHLQVVSAALAENVGALEAGEQRMETIVDVARDLTAERDPAALLRKVCAAAREVTLAQHALLGLIDDRGQETIELFGSGFGVDDRPDAGMPPLGRAPLGQVVGERRPVRLDNRGGDTAALAAAVGRYPTLSFLGVPLATPARVFGWLALRNKLGAPAFTDRDEDVALALAAHAAIAYENVRLYRDLRQHADALEAEIADRRRAEEALGFVHQRTEYALAATRTGIGERDLTTDRLTWSATLASLFGLTPDRAPKTSEEFYALVHPEDRAAVERAIQKTVAEGSEYAVEFRAVWPDGSAHWIAGRGQVVREGGRPVRLLGVGIDISEQKSLEAQFRQAQKMEAVGHLAGGVAHDFNNMLTAILGNASLMAAEVDETSPFKAQIDEIVHAAERAATLTRQLLAFGRKQVMQPRIVDLNEIVDGMTGMLRRLIGEHIEFSTALDPDLAPVRADATQIEQIVMNLVVNARDAMPTGGQLSIATANVDLDDAYVARHVAIHAGRYVTLAVSDTGSGMSDETKARLFEPFFTTKERGKGTGLGLATVYGIVKQSEGYIWVYSEEGHGTAFKVYLPVASSLDRDVRARPAATPRPPRGRETVLLVEDEPSVRQLARVLLEKAGYRVLAAENAPEAAELFQRHADRIDLLITDVVMPGASGPALQRHLAEHRPDIKVLYMSGYADDAVQAQGRLDPDAVFLQKPFTGERLIEKVREALAR